MFSKNLGVHRLWPDKDRLQSTDEFLEKRGPITKIGVQNLGFGLMEKTEPRAQEPFFLDGPQRAPELAGLAG
jgi:hypothetical protein